MLENVDFDFVSGPQDVRKLRSRLEHFAETDGIVAIDTETTGLCPRKNQVRLIQVCVDTTALIVDLDGWRSGSRQVDWTVPGLSDLQDLICGGRPKVFHNAAFDLSFLRGEGLVVGGGIFDTMLAAKIINNGDGKKNDLGSVVQRVLNVSISKELQKANWGGEITQDMLAYSARDVVSLIWLVPELTERLKSSRMLSNFTLWDLFIIEMEILRPIALMQWHGFRFSEERALKVIDQLRIKEGELRLALLTDLDEDIRRRNADSPDVWLPRDPDGSFNTRERDSGSIRKGTKLYKGFNPRSTDQMTQRFTQAGIILPPNAEGKLTLDQNLLAALRKDYPLVDQYLTWKACATRISHIEKLIKSIGPDNRIHCSYRQLGTETGRLSAAEPNLQQVPREPEIRELFEAEDGYSLIVADFSQIELRVAAQLSGEPRMIEAYMNGRDLHTETASRMAGVPIEEVTKAMRQSAKIANFGLLFGAGAATLKKQAISQYGVDLSLAEAKSIVSAFRAAYPKLRDWQEEQGNMTTSSVLTKLGRRRILVGFNDKYTTRINSQVQGTAGDIAKLAIRLLWRELRKAPTGEARLIAMVHDELIMEVRDDRVEYWAPLLKTCMEDAGNDLCERVPIVAEVSWGKTWADAK